MKNWHSIILVVALIMLMSLLLPACTEPEATTEPATEPTSTSTTEPTTTPTTEPITTPTTEPTQSESKYGGTLRIGMNSDHRELGEPGGYGQIPVLQRAPSIEKLAIRDETGEIIPWLAESWEVSSDAKALTVYLKEGIIFHDGTDFDASAVKWNWERLKSRQVPEAANLESIDIIDDYTVRANLSTADNATVFKLCYWSGGMASPTAWAEHDEDWNLQHPIGTGPFKFISWEPSVSLKYERFDDYWQEGKPYLDAIEYVIVADQTTMDASFRSGEIDVLLNVSLLQVSNFEGDSEFSITRLQSGLGADESFIWFNGSDPDSPFTDVKVRQAVEYAINKQAIIDSLLFGYAQPANQWGSPADWAYNPNITGHPYDPDKARELLSEAGLSDGINTKLNCYTGPDQQRAEAIQGMLAEVGINAEVEPLTPLGVRELLGGGWEGMLLQTVPSDGNVPYRMIWVTSQADIFKVVYHTDEIDRLVSEALSATNSDIQQQTTWQAQQQIFEEQAVIVPLWIPDIIAVKYPKVQDDAFCVVTAIDWAPQDCWIEK